MPTPSQIIQNKFPFSPTPSQQKLFLTLDQFLSNRNESRSVLLVRGYAGTGKTSIVSVLVKVLPLFNYRSLLLAPTGRAAKVMSAYSGKSAFTIHKIIYRQIADRASELLEFKRQKSYHKETIFMVDEASMLSDDYGIGNQVLKDLIQFVFENPTNKLILIGDSAQLPPVGQTKSPALESDHLESTFDLKVRETELTEVMRQELHSGILFNATRLREALSEERVEIQFKMEGFSDVFRMGREKMEEGLRYAYQKYGTEKTIIICRSNRTAVQFNQFIRRQIHFFENEIDAGDILMIVRNNYFVLAEDSSSGFLANGDFVEVLKIISFEELYGFRFATLALKLVDYPDQEIFEAKVILNILNSPNASLTPAENKELYQEILKEYKHVPSRKITQKLRADPYLNALQVKFSYALTCHKSQGGQWDAVFVDQGFIREDNIDIDFMRWLYTAITRSSNELFLVNFDPNFFESKSY